MATSGITNTEFPADFIITEAYERCGYVAGDLTAWNLQTAINSLNLLFLSWQNLNVLEWNIELQVQRLTRGAQFFDTAPGTVGRGECLPPSREQRYPAGVNRPRRLLRDTQQGHRGPPGSVLAVPLTRGVSRGFISGRHPIAPPTISTIGGSPAQTTSQPPPKR